MPHLKKKAAREINKIYPLPWDKEKGEDFIPEDPKVLYKKALDFWENIDKKQNKN